jgi:hypothetical protein
VVLSSILFSETAFGDDCEKLLAAAQTGDVQRIEKMLKDGTDANCKRPGEGSTPLIAAANAGKTESLRILINNGANVNETNLNGWTALMGSVNGGYLDVCELLLASGADVNVKHKYGWTALSLAARKNLKSFEKILLKHVAKK